MTCKIEFVSFFKKERHCWAGLNSTVLYLLTSVFFILSQESLAAPRTKNIVMITPQFLVQELMAQFPREKCRASNTYFRQCFNISEKECELGLKSVLQEAGRRLFVKKQDVRIEATLAANYYGYELSENAALLFEKQFASKKKSDISCYQEGVYPE